MTDPGKKETAKRFGVLKQPKKVSVKLEDLEAAAGSDAKGGIPRLGVDNDAHGCPACPHPIIGGIKTPGTHLGG